MLYCVHFFLLLLLFLFLSLFFISSLFIFLLLHFFDIQTSYDQHSSTHRQACALNQLSLYIAARQSIYSQQKSPSNGGRLPISVKRAHLHDMRIQVQALFVPRVMA